MWRAVDSEIMPMNACPDLGHVERADQSETAFWQNVFERGGIDPEVCKREGSLGNNVVVLHESHLRAR